MPNARRTAEAHVRDLHAIGAHERAIAMALPPGPERDEHWMCGERLSDDAWAIEERFDLEVTPSGLWH